MAFLHYALRTIIPQSWPDCGLVNYANEHDLWNDTGVCLLADSLGRADTREKLMRRVCKYLYREQSTKTDMSDGGYVQNEAKKCVRVLFSVYGRLCIVD